jgi:hypothetical protein
MWLMNNPKGIDWKHVTFVMGTHVDHLPTTLPAVIYKRPCGNCGADTFTETEYPLDVPLLCNVCAATITAPAEHDDETLLLYDLPNAVKARLIAIAHERRIPVEAVYKDFIEWKLGRPTRAKVYNKSEKKTSEE